MINPRQHSALARRLIEACGGLEEASEHCRVNRSVLSGYQNPTKTASMPADVICELEEYCGEGIYSRRLANASDAAMPSEDLILDAVRLVELIAHFNTEAHEAMADRVVTQTERDKLSSILVQGRGIYEGLEALCTSNVVSIEREAG